MWDKWGNKGEPFVIIIISFKFIIVIRNKGQAGNTAALKLPLWIVVAIKIGDQTSLINKYEVGR